jgi:hypothetical protein
MLYLVISGCVQIARTKFGYSAYLGNYPENWLPCHDRVTPERTVTLPNLLMYGAMYLVHLQLYPTTHNA